MKALRSEVEVVVASWWRMIHCKTKEKGELARILSRIDEEDSVLDESRFE